VVHAGLGRALCSLDYGEARLMFYSLENFY
jgi:hypothetical protein